MGIPHTKQREKKSKISKALDTVDAVSSVHSNAHPPILPNPDNGAAKSKAGVGRPSPIPDREKTQVRLSAIVLDRLDMALLQEKKLARNSGDVKPDRSYLIEIAVKNWLDKKGY